MRVALVGLHKVRAKLADGSVREYYYAWRGGPRLEGKPGSPDFIAAYNEAIAKLRRPAKGTLFSLIAEFKASAEFGRLSASSQKNYRRYLSLIEIEFGDMPFEALEDRGARGVFKQWRDGMADRPRTADYAWTTLARILAFGVDRGRISLNACERGGRLYKVDRTDRLWTEDHIARFVAAARPELALALVMALWTGQRQGDLLRLSWTAYDGQSLRMKQSKTGRRVTIPAGQTLRDALDTASKKATTILVNSRDLPWTSDGFRTSWRDACEKAGIDDVTFHDIRGTSVTRLALAGATVPEIASITGHALKDVEVILDRHYLGRDIGLAESAMLKLETRTVSVK